MEQNGPAILCYSCGDSSDDDDDTGPGLSTCLLAGHRQGAGFPLWISGSKPHLSLGGKPASGNTGHSAGGDPEFLPSIPKYLTHYQHTHRSSAGAWSTAIAAVKTEEGKLW